MDKMPREYSMALGAGDTTPLRLTTAYAMLDNGGKKIVPTLIDRVQDRNGQTIYRADQRPCDGCSNVPWRHQPVPVILDDREQVADPDSTFQVVSMLEGVVERGTGVAVKAVGKPIAGKTGTTTDWKDAWFEGFTPDLAAGVYVGFDNPQTLGKGEQAAVVSAPIFRDFMTAALKDTPATPFRTPPGVQLYRVNPATGLPPEPGEPAIWEPFKIGTNPTTNRNFALNWSGNNEDQNGAPGDTAAPGASAAGAAAPVTAQDNGAAPAQRDAPRSGTGGLY
jgi:penicillin-binding protein 1A